jgi:hypothetical protein
MYSENSAIEIINVGSIFLNMPNIEKENSDKLCLPKHITWCTHTLYLISTCDVSKIVDTNYVKISKSIISKLFYFFNLVSRSTMASDKVFETCGCKFPVPVITR